ncbi:hypothetical protein BaRGS_00011138 [Batillaria attramentaria]|uniref:Uncharacterized protein n=1 Tax=Batillaria attramentaria TaxID=370345 RepID=A0ABD0LES9_9CAEN
MQRCIVLIADSTSKAARDLSYLKKKKSLSRTKFVPNRLRKTVNPSALDFSMALPKPACIAISVLACGRGGKPISQKAELSALPSRNTLGITGGRSHRLPP